MNLFLSLAFLFFIGSVTGWVIELFFRRFLSAANPERRWINPGFCTGPYLPLYGFGLCILYLLSSLGDALPFGGTVPGKIIMILAMTAAMTAIEYAAGLFCLKVSRVRLWDYSSEWGNVQGIICPKFSAVWGVLGAFYYFLIHPRILGALGWLSENLAFSFVIGTFFGVFAVDAANSARLVSRLKRFAEDNGVIVKYEEVKAHLRRKAAEAREKYRFFRPFHTERPLSEHLHEMAESFEKFLPKNRR